MNKQKRRWFPKKPACESGARDFMTVGLQEIKPALYLLIFGTFLSFIVMLVEIGFDRISKRCKSKPSVQPALQRWAIAPTKFKIRY